MTNGGTDPIDSVVIGRGLIDRSSTLRCLAIATVLVGRRIDGGLALLMQYNRLFEMVDRGSDVQVHLEPSGVAHDITNDPGAILAMNSFLHQAFG